MNIYIGNLALEVTEDELRREFTVFGEVTTVTIMNDEYIGSGQPKGYGFVEMQSHSEGEVAILHLNGKTLMNRVVDVIEALPLSDSKGHGFYVGKRGSRFSSKVRRRIIPNRLS